MAEALAQAQAAGISGGQCQLTGSLDMNEFTQGGKQAAAFTQPTLAPVACGKV